MTAPVAVRIEKVFLTLAELEAKTGVSARTWRGLIKRGSVPHRRLGKQILVPAAWLAGQVDLAFRSIKGTRR